MQYVFNHLLAKIALLSLHRIVSPVLGKFEAFGENPNLASDKCRLQFRYCSSRIHRGNAATRNPRVAKNASLSRLSVMVTCTPVAVGDDDRASFHSDLIRNRYLICRWRIMVVVIPYDKLPSSSDIWGNVRKSSVSNKPCTSAITHRLKNV